MVQMKSAANTLEKPLLESDDSGLDLAAARLNFAIDRGMGALLDKQKADGHWAFELEADATIPAEYILLQHYLDEIDAPLHAKMAAYLREIQGEHGGWPLFYDGAFNLSASVKAYFALKAVGDSLEAPHMARARAAILAAGGAERTNVFTRIQLALFGQVPWRAVPVMPVEIMNLPRWFPFHLDKVSYWSRTVIVPLLVLMAKKPQAKNPQNVHIQELFVSDPHTITDWIRGPYRSKWGHIFGTIDKVLIATEHFFPAKGREKAIERARAFVTERLNGEDGLGAIYPAMANSVMMYECLGYAKDHPDLLIAKQSLQKLLVVEAERAYCQPCLSPVWDTGLAGHALLEAGGEGVEAAARGAEWLKGKQILDVVGDWAVKRPNVRPGGWAFQYENAHYPDVDDTAVVGLLLDRLNDPAIRRGDRPRRRVDRGAAEQKWWLGRVRCRQYPSLSEPHSFRRSWSAARSTDCRRDRPLPQLPRPARTWSGKQGLCAMASPICAPTRKKTAPGMAAGAPTIYMVPGRCCAR